MWRLGVIAALSCVLSACGGPVSRCTSEQFGAADATFLRCLNDGDFGAIIPCAGEFGDEVQMMTFPAPAQSDANIVITELHEIGRHGISSSSSLPADLVRLKAELGSCANR